METRPRTFADDLPVHKARYFCLAISPYLNICGLLAVCLHSVPVLCRLKVHSIGYSCIIPSSLAVQVLTKAWSAALLNAIGDILAQKVVDKNDRLDYKRLGIFTLLVSPPAHLHLCLNALARHDDQNVLTKRRSPVPVAFLKTAGSVPRWLHISGSHANMPMRRGSKAIITWLHV